MPTPRAAIVVLTRGDRQAALTALDHSIPVRDDIDFILVVNDDSATWAPPPHLLDEADGRWRAVRPGRNLGVPGGRNEGLAASDAAVVIFLDDDAVVRTPNLIEATIARFSADIRKWWRRPPVRCSHRPRARRCARPP